MDGQSVTNGQTEWTDLRFTRGMEIIQFSTCQAKMYLTIETFTCPKEKLAYTLQCLNNLFFIKQYETRSTLVNSMNPDQLASLVNSVDPDQLASEGVS